MKKLFLTLIISALLPAIVICQSFTIPLTVSAVGTNTSRSINFGVHPLATYCIDQSDSVTPLNSFKNIAEGPISISSEEPFTDISFVLPSTIGGTAAWGDYDNDGDLDLVAVGTTATGELATKIYRNDAGTFVDINASLVGVSGNTATSWGDYDNDGDLDLLIAGSTTIVGNENPKTKIYRNDDGTFIDINAPLPGILGSVAWGDYNNDGYLDFILAGAQHYGYEFLTRIYRNNGNGTFTDINAGLPGAWGSSVAWGDYDNDGDLDLLLIGYGDLGVTSKIYRNDEGTFVDINAPLSRVVNGSVAWGDYDNDGDLDIVITGHYINTVNPFTTVYRNDNGIFTDIHPPLVQVLGSSVAWGDYDSDGDLDLIISGFRNTDSTFHANIYRNDIGTFVDISASLVGNWFGSVAWGDYDNDGGLDVLLSGITTLSPPHTPVLKIYRNNLGSNTFSVNTTPTSPFDLLSTVDENSVTLSWQRSTDNQTVKNGLTYNVRIGTTPDGLQQLSPMADISNGYRRVVRLGNTNHNSSWTIKHLSAGTYYWSVHAIDGAFAGSAFSQEQSFTIPPVEPFTDVSSVLPSIIGGTAAWGDYDNDGDLDLVAVGTTATGELATKIYRNDAGTFVDINAPLVGVGGNIAASWGDYDNDNDLDLLIAGRTGTSENLNPVAKIYRNDNGTFVDINAPLPGILGSVAWGDYDNDGYLDFILAGAQHYGYDFLTRIYRNNGNSTFTDINAGLPGVWGSSVAWGDYDNDGDLDLLLVGYGDLGVTSKIYRNDEGTFVDINAPLARVANGSVACGDYDNDGDLDIVITGDYIGGVNAFTTIYRNDNGFFVDIHPPLVQVYGSAAAWGDYDGDGDLDLLISGFRDTDSTFHTNIYRNDNGTFVDINASLVGNWFGSVAWGDYDNDGDLDIALSGITTLSPPHTPVLKIYRNNLGPNNFSVNTSPTSPFDLSSTVDANSVTLRWQRSTDNQTVKNGLTYNIRIGTTPEGVQQLSPMADISNGYRRVVRLGNTDYDSSWTIKHLTAGTYYWSVQAIDGAFAGSAFAQEQSFTISLTNIDDRDKPSTYTLHQNYPNPFNPSTVITFEVPAISHITLKIYDVLGQEVAMLVNAQLQPGIHQVPWQPVGLPSGIYTYWMMVDPSNGEKAKFINTKKMLLLK